jgi:hypothetical protein
VPQTVDVLPKGEEVVLPLLSQPLNASAAAIPSPGSRNLRTIPGTLRGRSETIVRAVDSHPGVEGGSQALPLAVPHGAR